MPMPRMSTPDKFSVDLGHVVEPWQAVCVFRNNMDVVEHTLSILGVTRQNFTSNRSMRSMKCSWHVR